MTDEEIVHRVRDGDGEAYSLLVARYQNAVYAQAYHGLQNFEDARDVAQEVFVRAYLHLEKLRESEKFGSWLRRITINQCRMWQRQQRKTVTADENAVAPHEVERIENRLMMAEALACLSDSSRLTIILFYGQSYSLQQIATFFDVPVTTVKSRLRNARARLRKELMPMLEETWKQETLPENFAAQIRQSIEAAKNGDCSQFKSLTRQATNNPTLENVFKSLMKTEFKEEFQPFTNPARRVILEAQKEAARLGNATVEPEHLLLGLLGKSEIIVQLFDHVGLSPAPFGTKIPRENSNAADSKREPKMSPRANRVLILAAQESKKMAQENNVSNAVSAEHLFLGLLRLGEYPIVETLRAGGLELENAREFISESSAPI